MKVPALFRRTKSAPSDTAPRRLADIDTGRRTAATHIDKPDSLSPTQAPTAPRFPHEQSDPDAIIQAITRLATAGALDEYVPDTLDGTVAAWQAGWDAVVEADLPAQILTSLHLGAQELENYEACRAAVRRLSRQADDLAVEIDNWRSVLRGEIAYLPFFASAHQDHQDPPTIPEGILGARARGIYFLTPVASDRGHELNALPATPAH